MGRVGEFVKKTNEWQFFRTTSKFDNTLRHTYFLSVLTLGDGWPQLRLAFSARFVGTLFSSRC